jgi:hypothetical protein
MGMYLLCIEYRFQKTNDASGGVRQLKKGAPKHPGRFDQHRFQYGQTRYENAF